MDFSNWIDRGSYYENPFQQGSYLWHEARKKLITASWAATCLEQDPFKTLDDLYCHLQGLPPKEIPSENRKYIEHGVIHEPVVRNWYRQTFKVEVVEVGLAVPKWDHRIGASLDGQIVGQPRCLEIKCPQKMYEGVQKYLDHPTGDPRPFIFPTHYAQMQMGMAITANQLCDYVVYDAFQKQIKIIKVPFVPSYWEEELYPAIKRVLSSWEE